MDEPTDKEILDLIKTSCRTPQQDAEFERSKTEEINLSYGKLIVDLRGLQGQLTESKLKASELQRENDVVHGVCQEHSAANETLSYRVTDLEGKLRKVFDWVDSGRNGMKDDSDLIDLLAWVDAECT